MRAKEEVEGEGENEWAIEIWNMNLREFDLFCILSPACICEIIIAMVLSIKFNLKFFKQTKEKTTNFAIDFTTFCCLTCKHLNLVDPKT